MVFINDYYSDYNGYNLKFVNLRYPLNNFALKKIIYVIYHNHFYRLMVMLLFPKKQ